MPPPPSRPHIPPASGGSGEYWRQKFIEAERELKDLQEITQLAEERRQETHADLLAGLETFVVKTVAVEVGKAMAGRLTPTPAMPHPALSQALSVPTPPVGFQALAPPMAYPPQMTAPPMTYAAAAGLPPMRGPMATLGDTSVTAYADQVKSERHVRLVLGIGALVVPLATLVVSALVSHFDKPEPPAPIPYVRPAALPPH